MNVALDSSVQLTRQKKRNQQVEADNKSLFGFWIYLMTDCVLFASLFATFVILRNNTFGGPSGGQLFSLNFVLCETLVLLTSSYTCGLGMLAAQRRTRRMTLLWLGVTFLLGLAFLILELTEFRHFVHEGDSWRRSGFLSGYFTLVATHGLHICVGLLWMAVLTFRIKRQGLNRFTTRQLSMFSLFWHFLDIIWIFIFTIVYMVGKL
jgi:cytochrome o ubiquinol oxidase subunit 3